MKKLLYFLPFLLLVVGCDDDDDPVIENEEEVITDGVLQLTPANGGAAIRLVFSDPDGEGGNDAVITGGTLAASTTYNGRLILTNNQEDGATTGNISDEVREEDEDHQVFYLVAGLPGTTVAYDDAETVDDDGNPLGLLTTLTTGTAGSGMLTVVLRHEPTKGAGVGISDVDSAGGETDIEVEFPLTVQ